MTSFDRHLARGLDRARQHAGRSVVYSRGGESVTVTALRGNSRYQLEENTGFVTEKEVRDFIIEAEPLRALVFDGSIFEPKTGDRIVETVHGRTRTFSVRPPSPATPHWSWVDPDETTMRIHTELSEEATAS